MATGAFLTSQADLVSRVLEASIRRVSLIVHFQVGSHKETVDVSAYFTDPAQVKKVISIPDFGGDTPPPDKP
jgi:hypothetical protein